MLLSWIIIGIKIVVGTIIAFGVARLFRTVRLPPVIGMLLCGCVLRLLHPSQAIEDATDPLVDVALAAMGLEIGSHLNESTFGNAAQQTLRFMVVFVALVWGIVSLGAQAIMPDMAPFAFLVASIAVERSSPECLQGITEARAKGPFSTSLMCISAMQDVMAIVLFVIAEIMLGATSFYQGVGYIGFMLLSTVFACTCAAGVGYVLGTRQPILCAAAMAMILAGASEVAASELLLSAVMCGIILNYRKQHVSTAVISKYNQFIAVVLFTWMGYRMRIDNLISFSIAPELLTSTTTATGSIPPSTHQHAETLKPHKHISAKDFVGPHHDTLPPPSLVFVLGLYLLRLVALFVGSLAGSWAAGMRQFFSIRWLGLVTQLAIALSLVQRAEKSFPHSAPIMRAYGGAILLSLLTGPALLQLALHRSGEAGTVKSSAAAGSVEDGNSASSLSSDTGNDKS